MPLFAYRVKKIGATKIERGVLEAGMSAEVVKRLKAQGYLVLSVNEIGRPTNLNLHSLLRRRSVPLREKIIFTRQLSVMIKAGLSVVKALETLGRQTDNLYFQTVINELARAVKGGKALSAVMIEYPKVFPEIYVAVIRAGEETGQLAEVLLNLADQQEKEAELIAKIKGAMIYPTVILVALVGVVGLIVFFVLPSLQTIFAEYRAELPLATRLLFSISLIVRQYFVPTIIIVGVLIYLLRWFVQQPFGRQPYDRLKLRLPIFGALITKVYMARYARTMSMLIQASLPILTAIQIVQKTINNSLYTAAFARIEKEVESGRPLSSAMDKEKLFPPMVSQLASLGEESGSLEAVLLEVARFYDSEVGNLTRNLSSLIEPLMLIIMGVGVGFVVLSVISPIYSLVNQF